MSFIGKDEARRRRRARVAEWAESLPSGQFVDVQQMLGEIDEIDRLRAELAETRAAGDYLADAVDDHTPGFPADHFLVEAATAWRAVRDTAPAAAGAVREGEGQV